MVRVLMIVEVAGRPAEHLKKAIGDHVERIKLFKEIEVHSIKISDAKEIETVKGFFTCFAEVDFETESFSRVTEIVFDFMPSSVEIIEPAKVSLDSFEATNLLNNIAGRMHRYDEIARAAQVRIKQLSEQVSNGTTQKTQEVLVSKDEKKVAKEKKKKVVKKSSKKKN